MAQVGRSFGISESCLARWLRIADRDDGLAGKPAAPDAAGDFETENRELRKANEILRKASAYFAAAELDRRSKP